MRISDDMTLSPTISRRARPQGSPLVMARSSMSVSVPDTLWWLRCRWRRIQGLMVLGRASQTSAIIRLCGTRRLRKYMLWIRSCSSSWVSEAKKALSSRQAHQAICSFR
ncbi:hypothetical protein D3C85_892100 [compost metagenome]